MARAKKKVAQTAEEKLAAALVPEAEQPYEVPENWRWVRLGSVCGLKAGKNIKASEISQTETTHHKYPCIGGNGVRGFVASSNRSGRHPIIGRQGALCGNVQMAEGSFYATEHAVVVDSSATTDTDWLYYALKQLDLHRFATATAQPGLAVGKIAVAPLPLPPLPEQRRIVERVESLFAKLDEAESKLRAILAQSETRRTAILHDVFSGKLTKAWRDEHGVSSDTWKRMQLGDVLLAKPRNGYSPKPVAHETPYKSLSLSAVTKGVFDPTCFKYVDIDIDERSYLWLEPGDILLQRANSLEKVGTSALYMGESHEFVYPDLMMKLQVKEGISSTFFAYQLKLPTILHHFRANATGTAGNMPKINQKTVCSAPVVMPSLSEQKEIVRRLDSLFAKQDAADARVNDALSAISTLRQTILARALRGELWTNDPAEDSLMLLLMPSP